MHLRAPSRAWVFLCAVTWAGAASAVDPGGAVGSRGAVEATSVLPMASIAPELRQPIAEVIELHHFHHRGSSETFPCQPRLYLGLLNDPALTLALWQDLSPSPARLQEVAPGSYQGSDGNGTTATWQFAYRSPRLHVLLGDLSYQSPRGAARLEGRLVLIVRTNYFKENNGSPWIQHEIEAFVKVDSKGWRAVARTVRPLVERLLEDQIQEAGWFISLMGRLVETHPDWAIQAASNQPQLSPATRAQFSAIVTEHRRPDASSDRPQLTAEPTQTVRR